MKYDFKMSNYINFLIEFKKKVYLKLKKYLACD